MKYEYAIIVRNKTRLESLIERFNTASQARFYIESMGGDFSDYVSEHEVFQDALATLQGRLTPIIKNKLIERRYVSSYLFSEKNIIVVIGQDGLVANTAKYARGQPIIAVNPDKKRYDGILLPFDTETFATGVTDLLEDRSAEKIMRFAEARLNDGQRLLAFNDLFIGPSTHISARYRISYNNLAEQHSSSGIIVSTMAGCTGWMSSVFNMAYGVAGVFEKDLQLKWPTIRADELLFAVREPFKSITSQTGINAGVLNDDYKLVVESLMPAHGIIFSDGIEKDFLHFNSGAIATIGLAPERARLVIPGGREATR